MIRRRCDEGVTEVIGFVLIAGLIAVVLLGMALVVPQMNGAEIEGELAFAAVQGVSDLKYDMDLLWEDGTFPQVTRSVLMQLSMPEKGVSSLLPVFTPQVGSATLTAGGSDLQLNISQEGRAELNPRLLRLVYSTSNHYAPDSVVVYDAGAVFAGTRDVQSLVLAPSVGKAADGSLLVVLPVLDNRVGESSVSGNSFGVVVYQRGEIGTEKFPNPTITISGTSAAANTWRQILQSYGWDEGTNNKYSGNVTVMTVNYSLSVRGAVP